jgi:hypothetical protein
MSGRRGEKASLQYQEAIGGDRRGRVVMKAAPVCGLRNAPTDRDSSKPVPW